MTRKSSKSAARSSSCCSPRTRTTASSARGTRTANFRSSQRISASGNALPLQHSRAPGRRFDSLGHPEPGKMREVRTLREGLPGHAERLGPGIPGSRRPYPHRGGRRRRPRRKPLHQMRPVLGSLPRRRDLRKRRHQQGLGSPSGPEQALRRSDRPRGPRSPRRGLRP